MVMTIRNKSMRKCKRRRRKPMRKLRSPFKNRKKRRILRKKSFLSRTMHNLRT